MRREPWEWHPFSDLPADVMRGHSSSLRTYWLRAEYPLRAWIRAAIRNLGPGALQS